MDINVIYTASTGSLSVTATISFGMQTTTKKIRRYEEKN